VEEISPAGDVVINFVDADIHEVMKAILGRTLRVNYVIDPAIKGRITIQTSRPLTRQSVIPMLEMALPMVGATLIVSGDFHRVVPLAKAIRNGARVSWGQGSMSNRPGYGVQIVPLQYVGAQEMKKILDPMVPEGSQLHVDPVRNFLIFAGTRSDLEYMLETVHMFDVDWLKGMSFGLFPLEYADVSTILKDLETVFGDAEKGPLAGLLRLVPIDRLNAILAVSAQPAYLDKVSEWIERLDRSEEGPGRQLFVYFVQNGEAEELAAVLSKAIGFERAEPLPATTVAPGLKPVQLTSRRGSQSEIADTGAQPKSEPVQQQQTGQRYQKGREDKNSLDIMSGGEFRVVADDSRNALLITATRAEYQVIATALKKLDLVPLQVLMEATIAEVTLRDQLQYGLQWFFRSGNNDFTFSSSSGGGVAKTFPGFSYFFSSTNATLALNALSDLTDVNVISSPQLLVLNNATATLTVGDQVPIATQSSVSSTDPDAPIVNSIQYRDTGVTLRVTPRVNAGGLVTLDIEEETSEVAETTTSGIDSPTIQQRRITSTVVVHSGETVALGGLIKDTTSNTKSGLPLLSSIPILGALFRTTSDDERRTELIVLITPRVIRSRNDARVFTEEMRQRLRGLRSLHDKIL
jgi:general secretion pathway protein D